MKVAFVAEPRHRGLRLDKVVAGEVSVRAPELGATRGAVQRWIDEGAVLVAGRAGKRDEKLLGGEAIVVTAAPPEKTNALPDSTVPFDVLYDDGQLVVVHKPAGVVVHPAKGHETGTLVNGLLALGGFDFPDEGEGHVRPGIVHRLDRDTSGVMVVARTPRAREGLTKLFAEHDIERSYLAVTVGRTEAATISALHNRHPVDRMRFSSRVEVGKNAITHVTVERRFGDRATLVRCVLETGRTHQIRVHLAEIAKTPVLADAMYGKRPKDATLAAIGERAGRQLLHAEVLGFKHPVTGEPLRFVHAPPVDMQTAIAEITNLGW